MGYRTAWIGFGMKVGSVWGRGRLFPTARLEIKRVGYGPVPLAAIIDTGFTEWLTLPPEIVGRLGLLLIGRDRLILGNLARDDADVYEGRVHWGGTWRTINVHEFPGNPTIGMELLRGHRIEFDALGDAEIDVERVVPAKS